MYPLILRVLKIELISLQNIKFGFDTICHNLSKALTTLALYFKNTSQVTIRTPCKYLNNQDIHKLKINK